MKCINNYFFAFCTLLIISCSQYPPEIEKALEFAGENKQDLVQVLEHYNKNPKDSLKYRAALFLIKNSPYHSFQESVKEFNFAFDKIETHQESNNTLRNKFFLKILDSISSNNKGIIKNRIYDVQYIKADFLIENIELAFRSWSRVPIKKRASFSDFCNYILPYRASNEPIEYGVRKRLASQYNWAYKLLKNGATLRKVVDSITAKVRLSNIQRIKNYYPLPFSISQVEKSKIGICDDIVNYYVNVFRALGLISTKDMIGHWGNHHSTGHSWIYVKYGTEEYSTDIRGNVDNKLKYDSESVPKVYRIGYCYIKENSLFPIATDVTDEYVDTINVEIENIFGIPNSSPVLSVFDKAREWSSITLGKAKKDKFLFDNIGLNVLYMAGNLDNGNVIPSNYPFFVNQSGEKHFFIPEKNQILDSVHIVRKYGFSTPINRYKIKWLNNLNESFFEVSNMANFEKSKVIHRIEDLRSTHLNTVKLEKPVKAKYARFNSNSNNCFLAELAFLDEKGIKQKGEIIEHNTVHPYKEDAAFDNNPLSFSGGRNFYLGFKFNEIKSIGSLEYQARNDDNHINVGEEYELFFWDRKWISLGVQKAKDTILYYNVPKNSLLWLKNHSKGKEEHVFYINDKRKQMWLGFDN